MDVTALVVTLELAVLTTLLLFLIGLPIAAWLVGPRWPGKSIVESIVALPLVLPPTVLGFYILVALGPSSVLGRTVEWLSGSRLPFTFQGILVAAVIANLPFSVRPFMAALSGVDRRLVEAAWCLGESKWRTFFRITLPLAWPGILTGVILTFAHTIGEFGVVLMVGGNIPGATRTLSIALYDDVQALDYASAHQTALILVAVALLAMSLVQALDRRGSLT